MRVGFLEGDLSIGFDEHGELQTKAILSSSYNVLPIWLRIAHDNMELARIAFEAIANGWDEDPDNQRKLLLAELTPAIQTFVACGIAFDAFYDQIKSFAGILEADAAAWKVNRTSRASQISEVIRRVYKLDKDEFVSVKKTIKDIIKWRDSAVHPSTKLKPAMNRPDFSVGVDWRFCMYRYENASICYQNTMYVFSFLREKKSPKKEVNEGMEIVYEALDEMGLVVRGGAQK
jgi:hypothetical protein